MSIVKLNNNGVKNATSFGSASSGSMTFIKKLTASSSSTLSFVDGSSSVVLDNTYKEYLFTFKNIHPATNNADLTFQGNAAGGSGFDETITNTVFFSQHAEDASYAAVAYSTGRDQAQSTDFADLSMSITNDNDGCCSGYLHLFNPSSTTFVKHFIGQANEVHDLPRSNANYIGGYCNTTSAINAVKFNGEHSEGDDSNIDAGTIILYGIN